MLYTIYFWNSKVSSGGTVGLLTASEKQQKCFFKNTYFVVSVVMDNSTNYSFNYLGPSGGATNITQNKLKNKLNHFFTRYWTWDCIGQWSTGEEKQIRWFSQLPWFISLVKFYGTQEEKNPNWESPRAKETGRKLELSSSLEFTLLHTRQKELWRANLQLDADQLTCLRKHHVTFRGVNQDSKGVLAYYYTWWVYFNQ